MFDLTVLTLEKPFFNGSVYSVIIPGADGYFQILSNHAPLISLVQPGVVEIEQREGNKEIFAISGGFFEISHNKATLIADAFEKASDIDYQRAVISLENAQARLNSGENQVDIERARLAVKRAKNRIKIYQQTHLQTHLQTGSI